MTKTNAEATIGVFPSILTDAQIIGNPSNTTGSGYTFVTLIPASSIANDGTKISLILQAGNSAVVVDEIGFSQKASSGDAWDSEAGTLVEVTTDGGNSGYSFTNYEICVTDFVDFDLDSSVDHLVSLHTTSGNPGYLDVTAFTGYNKAATDEALTEDRSTGYSTNSGRTWFTFGIRVAVLA